MSTKMLPSSALFLPQSCTAAGPAWSFPLAKSELGGLEVSLAVHTSFICSVKSWAKQKLSLLEYTCRSACQVHQVIGFPW